MARENARHSRWNVHCERAPDFLPLEGIHARTSNEPRLVCDRVSAGRGRLRWERLHARRRRRHVVGHRFELHVDQQRQRRRRILDLDVHLDILFDFDLDLELHVVELVFDLDLVVLRRGRGGRRGRRADRRVRDACGL
jgi:hypothetical protein